MNPNFTTLDNIFHDLRVESAKKTHQITHLTKFINTIIDDYISLTIYIENSSPNINTSYNYLTKYINFINILPLFSIPPETITKLDLSNQLFIQKFSNNGNYNTDRMYKKLLDFNKIIKSKLR